MMVAYLFHLEDDITGGARTGLFFGFSFVSSGLCAGTSILLQYIPLSSRRAMQS